jgi:hypothetical protein
MGEHDVQGREPRDYERFRERGVQPLIGDAVTVKNNPIAIMQ